MKRRPGEQWGLVQSVDERRLGSVLAAAASALDESITVENTQDFTGADDITVEVEQVTTTGVAEDTLALALSAPLAGAHAEGAEVLLSPVQTSRVAYVEIDLDTEPTVVIARVPHTFRDRVPVGVREPEDRERVLVRHGTWGWELVDVLGKNPEIDGSYLVPGTGGTSDGEVPPTSSAPTVRGAIWALYAEWSAVENADPVTYEVHVSSTTDFTPSGSTLYGEIAGTQTLISSLPGGGVLLSGVTYYVKIVAKDADGASAASAQGSSSIDALLAAVLRSAASGLRWELDSANGLRGYDSAGVLRMQLDVSSSPPTIRIWDGSSNLTARLDGADNLLTGTFRTGTEAKRIVLNEGFAEVELWDETWATMLVSGKLNAFTTGAPQAGLSIEGPQISGGAIPRVQLFSNPSSPTSDIFLSGIQIRLGDSTSSYAQMRENTVAPSTPAADRVRLYAKDKASTSALYYKNDAGTEFDLGRVYYGTATPEGAVVAPIGSLFLRTDGGAATTLYVKESGAGNTGWVAVNPAGGAGVTDADFLVGTAHAGLSNEIVVGAAPGGELGGTWGTPTVDATHAGSAHHTAHVLGAVSSLARDNADGSSASVSRTDHQHGLRTRVRVLNLARVAQTPGTSNQDLDSLTVAAGCYLIPIQVRSRILGTANTNLISNLRFNVIAGNGQVLSRDTATGSSGITAQFINVAAQRITTGDIFAAPAFASAEAIQSFVGVLVEGDKFTGVTLRGRRSNTTDPVEWDFQVYCLEVGP